MKKILLSIALLATAITTQAHCYVIGNDAFGGWDLSKLNDMGASDASKYYFVVTPTVETLYFSFACNNPRADALSVSDWKTFNGTYRIGPTSTEEDQIVTMGEWTTAQKSGGSKAYELAVTANEPYFIMFKFDTANDGDFNGQFKVCKLADMDFVAVGSSEAIFGTTWDPSNSDNKFVYDSESQTFKVTKKNVVLSAGEITYKAATLTTSSNTWDYSFPSGNDNLTKEVEKAGVYNVTISSSNPSTGEITMTLEDATTTSTLATILESGTIGTTYTVDDELVVVKVVNDNLLFARDQNATQVSATGEQIDYVNTVAKLNSPNMQYNWVKIISSESHGLAEGDVITNPIGVYSADATLTLSLIPTAGEGTVSTDLNTYIPANFTGTQEGSDGKTYFFATPRKMEVANFNLMTWESGVFHMATSGVGVNSAHLTGTVTPAWDYNGENGVASDVSENLTNGKTYKFTGFVDTPSTTESAPMHRAAASGSTVYPLGFAGSEEVTAVTELETASHPVAVSYYDLTGRAIAQPTGLTIVVTRNADGSTTSKLRY